MEKQIDNFIKEQKLKKDLSNQFLFRYFIKNMKSNLYLSSDNITELYDGEEGKIEINNNEIQIYNNNYYSKQTFFSEENNKTIQIEETYLKGNRTIILNTIFNCDLNKMTATTGATIYDKEATDTFFRENFDGDLKDISFFFTSNYICPEDEFSLKSEKLHQEKTIDYEFDSDYYKDYWQEEIDYGYVPLIKMLREEVYYLVTNRTKGIFKRRIYK